MVPEISPKDLVNWISFLLPNAFSIKKDIEMETKFRDHLARVRLSHFKYKVTKVLVS